MGETGSEPLEHRLSVVTDFPGWNERKRWRPFAKALSSSSGATGLRSVRRRRSCGPSMALRVGGFDVAMYDALFMRRFQPLRDLASDIEGILQG